MSNKYDTSLTIDLPSMFEHAAAEWGGDGDALIAYRSSDIDGDMARWSRAQLAADVRRTATLFKGYGLDSENRIALLLPTIPEIHLLLWGGMSVAGVALINPLLQIEHILHLLDELEADILCVPTHRTSPTLAAVVRQINEARPKLRMLTVGAGGDFPAMLQQAPIDVTYDFDRPADALAALFHTGGTTGRPKITPLSLANLTCGAQALTPALAFSMKDRFFSPLPLFHIAGAIVGGLAPLLAGTAVVMPAPAGMRDPNILASFWRLLEKEHVTMMVAVPTSIAALCNVGVDGADLSALDYVLTGTAPLPLETARRFSAVTGKEVHTGYGMTETSGVIAYAPRNGPARPETAGEPLVGVHVRIEPISVQHTLVGRVMVKGANVFHGYLGGAKRSADEWFDTGDLGLLSEDGWLTLTGRSKDLIIRSGHNIDPALIEEVAARHADVVLAAAVGLIDDYAGEVPALYVELRAGADEVKALAELAALLERDVSEPPARPKIIEAIAAMPTTAVGKIYKPALRLAAANKRIKRLFAEEGIEPASIEAKADLGGAITIQAVLHARDKLNADKMSKLINRFPVDADVTVSAEQAM